MGQETESGIQTSKAFKKRSVLFRVLCVFLVLMVLTVMVFGGMALFFKDAWRDVRSWTAGHVESGQLILFRDLSKDFIADSDLKDDDKSRWNVVVDRMTDVMEGKEGSDEQRKALRAYFDTIAAAMKDNDLRSSELSPLYPPIEALLSQIDRTEKAKQG